MIIQDKSILDSLRLRTQRPGKELRIWILKISISSKEERKKSVNMLLEILMLNSKISLQELI
jgi:hypothetical protein